MPRMDKREVIYPQLSYAICGLCFKVHNELGRFKTERSYADGLEQLLKENNIIYVRESALPIAFKGEAERRNIPDFLIDDKIIVDLKAKRIITRSDYYQMRRYLDTADKKLGLIINFQQKYLSPKRVLNSKLKNY